MQPKFSQNAIKMQSKCSQNSVTSCSAYRLKSFQSCLELSLKFFEGLHIFLIKKCLLIEFLCLHHLTPTESKNMGLSKSLDSHLTKITINIYQECNLLKMKMRLIKEKNHFHMGPVEPIFIGFIY